MSIKYILVFILGLVFLKSCCTFSSPEYNGEITDHFDGERFYNQAEEDSVKTKGFWDLVKWNFSREPGEWNYLKLADTSRIFKQANFNEILVTHIGHASLLIQYDGLNILTDPVWSDITSPVSFIGPERRVNPGINIDSLPRIDYILISHNHYDHLDIPTLESLKEVHNFKFIVPLGVKGLLEEHGFDNVAAELDWWQSFQIDDSHSITAAPARHFSMRGLCDRNKTLWCSFVISTSSGNVYYAGDTGYGKHFRQIFERFGPMRLSFLPIGPIEPRWFMQPVHMSSEDAVIAHLELHSQTSIPIHHSTFNQGDDSQFDPLERLKTALIQQRIPLSSFYPLKFGIQHIIENKRELTEEK